MKRLLMLFACCLLLQAQTAVPVSYPEATGDAATHQFATTGTCRSIQIVVPMGNTAVVRVGDSTTSISKGLPIASGAGLFMSPLTTTSKQDVVQQNYNLSSLYYYAATGDKVDFLCLK